MFRRLRTSYNAVSMIFKNPTVMDTEKIAISSLYGGAVIGGGIGIYIGYKNSRWLSYSDCLIYTTVGAMTGGYFGMVAVISLPITLPTVIATTVFRLADDVLCKNDQNVLQNIQMNIKDLFD